MSTDKAIGFPAGSSDERELLLNWLGYLRGAVLRKLAGISDEQARWRPGGALISLLGIVNHLTGTRTAAPVRRRRWVVCLGTL